GPLAWPRRPPHIDLVLSRLHDLEVAALRPAGHAAAHHDHPGARSQTRTVLPAKLASLFPGASSITRIVQRVVGSFGAAVLAVILAHALLTRPRGRPSWPPLFMACSGVGKLVAIND